MFESWSLPWPTHQPATHLYFVHETLTTDNAATSRAVDETTLRILLPDSKYSSSDMYTDITCNTFCHISLDFNSENHGKSRDARVQSGFDIAKVQPNPLRI